MKAMSKALSVFLILILAISAAVPAMAADKTALQSDVAGTAAYMYKTVPDPLVGSIGGEWAVIGLARSGYDVPDTYYQNYYATVEAYVKEHSGVLDERKYTEYSRVTVALTAIGRDPANVAGYNLLTPLGDFDKTIWQGINGPIWALIALDSGSYAMPKNTGAKTQATRQMYVDEILSRQLADGGWSLTGKGGSAEAADPDLTGMALQALAKYMSDNDVKTAVDKALTCLSGLQTSSGGFFSWGAASSESVVQVLVGLCELGVSVDDSRFVKNEKTLLDNLLTYRQQDGSFEHTADGSGSNQMATEQGFYGIVAALRAAEGKSSLYRMSDAIKTGGDTSGPKAGEGLAGKNADVRPVPVAYPGKTFSDIAGESAQASRPAIEALAERGIISGKTDTTFDPDATMTRAEFAAMVVRGLGLTPKAGGAFTDVPPSEWYAAYVGTVSSYGIAGGVTAETFAPQSAITREEAAVMLARAAALCGLDTALDGGAVRDVLAQFTDYTASSDWARQALAFCYQEGILPEEDIQIRPKDPAKRSEVAQMLFGMLGDANLL
ncbi:S-layer homology domain-containing protein [Sporobacter termitidis DSM 10068]|uniref:S-layer homology domain-containing protein n=1 Tax=Sporobacter termitidis DSM 10068 TaxID=1123282 RepID=A0A1M5XGZ6_9FIRM|nr:S-layer homology domain-containing protein [Sporobacter termitidis]SHH98902.1 S-layer homology domain-containing protein [Sporobacter termitidis DSM 10068]